MSNLNYLTASGTREGSVTNESGWAMRSVFTTVLEVAEAKGKVVNHDRLRERLNRYHEQIVGGTRLAAVRTLQDVVLMINTLLLSRDTFILSDPEPQPVEPEGPAIVALFENAQ